MKGFRCQSCGEWHDELPMHYGAPAPAVWFRIPEAEREQRCRLSSDQCIIDEQFFFIVGNLESPRRRGRGAVLLGRLGVAQREELRAGELWQTPGRESEPPYFGWLSTALPVYPDTLSLKTLVHTRQVGRRPYVELEPTDHPLAVEQRQGITTARVQEIAELVLHRPQDG